MSAKSLTVYWRRPFETGLYARMPIILLRGLLEELDVAAFTERHDRLLPISALRKLAAHALPLSTLYQRVHARDFDVEHGLDRVLDLDLVCVQGHFEHDLIAF